MQIVPLVGWALDGARITERDLRVGTVAEPVWGPRGFLTDLELRTGIGPLRVDPMARLIAWRARAEALAAAEPDVFFARSLAVDPWATAKSLLAMRDELVLAGWEGQGAGHAALGRVRALAALDGAHAAGPLPPGEVDRVARVTRALALACYPRVVVSEPISDWPGAWQRLLARLEALGVVVEVAASPVEEEGGGANVSPSAADGGATDLARVRRALRLGVAPDEQVTLVGDGSFVLLTGETPEPLAEAVAAILRAERAAHPERVIAVLRTAELGPLEAALRHFGLPRLGGFRSTGVPLAGAWLPLVMALAQGDFRAEQALDLVLMPHSGLAGRYAGRLARALQEAPGLGSRWAAAVEHIRAHELGVMPAAVERVLDWVKPNEAASVAEIARRIDVLEQVLASRVKAQRLLPVSTGQVSGEADGARLDALEAARVAVAAWLRALPSDDQQDLGLVANSLDALLRTFGAVAASTLTLHEAGGLERVDDPAALCASVDTLVWWGFVDPGGPATSAFRERERAALAGLGVLLETPADVVRRRAEGWRRLLGRARRLVLVVPGRIAGARQAPHPLWAEIRGRLRWESDAPFAKATTTPAELIVIRSDQLAAASPASCREAALGLGVDALRLPLAPVARVVWPAASTAWQLPFGPMPAVNTSSVSQSLAHRDGYSVSSLETLLSCPLRFVLDRRARFYERAVGVLKAMPVLLGNLGHRLVETLFEAGELSPAGVLGPGLEARIEALIGEDLTLLRATGRRVEHDDVVLQLAAAVRAAVAWLEQHELTPRAVEEDVDLSMGERRIEGRLDLRADGPRGNVIIDFKWSTRKYATAIRGERAVQLAAYAYGFRVGDVLPDGAFIGLREGTVAAADGAQLARTWRRVVALLGPLEAALDRGEVSVTGVAGAPTLAAVLGVPGGLQRELATICDYCRFDLVCGKGLVRAPTAEDDDDD